MTPFPNFGVYRFCSSFLNFSIIKVFHGIWLSISNEANFTFQLFLEHRFLNYLYSGIVLFFVISSIYGVKQIGIRFVWLSLYKIKAHATKPQALALMSLTLILILLALSRVLFTIAPDYTIYGSQRFVLNITETNVTKIVHCNDAHAPTEECNMTRVSVLLLALHTKAW